MRGVTYDAGALIAAERRNVGMWRRHVVYQRLDVVPVVSVAVLGQVWRGGPQAQLSRLLRGCWVEPLDELTARDAGAALGRSGTSDLIDAVVVITAARRDDVVLTSDPDDLMRIASAVGADLHLIAV